MRPIALALLALTMLARCAGPGVDSSVPTEVLQAQAQELSTTVQTLIRTQDEHVWKHWIEGTPLDLATSYAGAGTLFSAESVQRVEQLRGRTEDARERRALTHLKSYLAGEHLAQALGETSSALAGLEMSGRFRLEADEYAFRDLERLLANERNAAKRRALYAGASSVLAKMEGAFRQRDEKLAAAVRALGYPSIEAVGNELREGDLEALAVMANRFLDATRKPYEATMAQLARSELGVSFAQLSRADFPRLFRPKGVDTDFPKTRLVSRAQATLSGLGIDLARLQNLTLALDDSPKKNPRPLALAVEIPSDVRVSLKLVGGLRDQAVLLHQLGTALRDVHTTEKRFELTKLGSPTVGRAFALLFQDLVEDPTWLDEQAGLVGARQQRYLSASAAHQLFLVRRAAGRLLYALELQRKPGTDRAALYRTLMSRTYGLPVTDDDVARARWEQDELYASADALRAWFLAGQLQAQLKARFGAAWWKKPEAGGFLKGLWAHGNALPAEELPRSWGEEGLQPESLIRRLSTALGGSGPIPTG